MCNCKKKETARELADLYKNAFGSETIVDASATRALLTKNGVEQKTRAQRVMGYRARQQIIGVTKAREAEEYCLLPQLVEDFMEMNPGE